ncbi:transcription factor MYC3-like [Pyrus x bretschneideri]|uniref:transcription factor MYC3-like n=1 Tax=Pyrus x bretschneideri TaxID=225117 RepID=UPI000511A087|nr:transcription factor MYC3-like [Pyrus x bretschneideri]
MEAILSSFSSPNFRDNPSSSTFKQRLQFIVESNNAAECWVYAIFWEATGDNNLSWGGGHYKSSNINSYQPKLGFSDVDFVGNNDDGDVTDSEWFYFYSVSLTQSFTADNNILGRAFCSGGFVWLAGDHEFQLYECERVKEARMHGIQTLVCIATLRGVLELASLDVIKQDWGLVHLTKSLFRSNDNDDDHNRLPNQQASREASGLVPPLKNGRFLGAQEELTTQEGGGNEATPINIGGSSISPPDSRSNSVGNFTSKNIENTQSKKRGRPSSNHGAATRESQLLSHVEAERLRRVKFNRLFCVLRSVVPNVSKMDRSSLLADAVAYINQLKAKVEELETKIQAQLPPPQKSKVDHNNNVINIINLEKNSSYDSNRVGGCGVEVDVKIIGSSEAIIRVLCPNQDYPYARLMNVLKGLGLQVSHASISSINELMIQNVVTRLPYGFTSGKALRLGIIKGWYI